jgi:hypothetical protein
MEEIEDIWKSIRDIEQSLKLVQRETQSLGNDSEDSKEQKKVVSNPTRAENGAQSAWAKSTVPSAASIAGLYSKNKVESGQDAIISLDSLVHADKVLYTSKPSHNFGLSSARTSKSTTEIGDITIPGPATYHYTDKALSNKRRPRSATLIGSGRKDLFNADNKPPPQTPTTNDTTDETTTTKDHMIIEYEYLIAGGYSFGKANRFQAETVKENTDTPQTILDVENSLKILETHVPTAVLVKPAPKETRIATQSSPPSTALEPNIEVVSHRMKAPAVRFIQPTPRDPKFLIISKSNQGQTPGPNHYSIEEEALMRTKKGTGISTGIHFHYSKDDSESTSTAVADTKHHRTKQEAKELESLRGPGCYDLPPSTAETGHGILKFAYSETKDTKALKLKQYYEQKAAEMRDYHDDMKLSNAETLHRRVPVVHFESTAALKKKKADRVAHIIAAQKVQTRSMTKQRITSMKR